MSIKAVSWVMDDAPVESTTEMVVLYVLADHAGNDGAGAWPSHSTIADKSRCSRRTVIRHLKALEGRGLIVRGDQRHVAHLPADRRPVVWNLNLKVTRHEVGNPGCHNVTPAGDGVTPVAERGDTRGKDGVTPVAERGDTRVTQTVLEPSLEPSSNPPLAPPGGGAAAPAAHAAPPTPRTKQAHDLPDGWMPDDHVIDQMRAERPDVDLEAEHRKFMDHWPAQPGARGRKKDWNATWRNWIRNARSHRPARTSPSANSWAAWGMPEMDPHTPQDDLFAGPIIDHQEHH